MAVCYSFRIYRSTIYCRARRLLGVSSLGESGDKDIANMVYSDLDPLVSTLEWDTHPDTLGRHGFEFLRFSQS